MCQIENKGGRVEEGRENKDEYWLKLFKNFAGDTQHTEW